jgi:hypothetical protein
MALERFQGLLKDYKRNNLPENEFLEDFNKNKK